MDMDLVYFWAAILIALVPVAVFAWMGVLVTRAYFRRRAGTPDGGGDPGDLMR